MFPVNNDFHAQITRKDDGSKTTIWKTVEAEVQPMSITLNTVEHNSNPWANSMLHQRLIESGAYDLRKYRRIIDLGNGYSRVEPMWTDERQPRYGDGDGISEYRRKLREE